MNQRNHDEQPNRLEQITGDNQRGEVGAPAKLYVKPALKLYGAVSDLTLGVGSHNGDGSSLKPTPSDRALKQKIVRAGTHPLGIGLYLFDYKPEHRQHTGTGRHFGVMADEVAGVKPDAVGIDERGFAVVNYSMLGIEDFGTFTH